MKRISVADWQPIDVKSLEPKADWVVRSNINCSVIAGPGAGKTELLAQRACFLLQTATCPPPYRILAISFKKDAARNLADRVKVRCPEDVAYRFDSLTFDAFAKSLVDRFIKAIPHDWQPKSNYDIPSSPSSIINSYRYFLSDLANSTADWVKKQNLKNLNPKTFERSYVVGTLLPLSHRTVGDWAAQEWWHRCLKVGDTSILTFAMLSRLAELLLRTNPYICKLLRATYTHVFMDEFQDTTNIQYDLVKTAFCDSKTVLTAVGDNKQHIMRWAGALDNAFKDFEQDFKAERHYLRSNYRSSSALVDLHHAVALIIDTEAELAQAMKDKPSLSGDASIIWEFSDKQSEMETLASHVASTLDQENLKPRDFVILVKQKSKDYAEELSQVFSRYNLVVRDESNIQDLLSEPLTRMILLFIQFALTKRAGYLWSECYDRLEHLSGVDPENETQQKQLEEALSTFHSGLHQMVKQPIESDQCIQSVIDKVIHFLGIERIKALYPEYQQKVRFKSILKNLLEVLAQGFAENEETQYWHRLLEDFEGLYSIPVMTIHKSKGLEYHTVIFFALDDKAWWSFKGQPEESKCAFFVALSRAKERVIFTHCRQRGSRDNLSSLFDVLQQAGVKTCCYS
ncbi:MAG: ATP-dependent helicase [Cyanobacteria bacterium P01_A01_bin.17]